MKVVGVTVNSFMLGFLFITILVTQLGLSGVAIGSIDVPISGALILASSDSGGSYSTTLSNGVYIITQGLPNGSYQVTAIAEGYINKEISSVGVTVGAETKNVNFNLKRSGGVSGRVTDATTGAGVSNAQILVLREGGMGWFGVTDSSGNYKVFTNLDTALYNITIATAAGYIQSVVGGVAITEGVETKNIDFSLPRSGIISGVVRTPAGAPVSGVTVTAISSDGKKFNGFATTSVDGSYRIESGLGGGTYNVMTFVGMSYDQVSDVKVDVSKETSDVNFTLNVAAQLTGEITGRVTDTEGNPISGVNVSAGSGFSSTGVDGVYKISTGLPTGTYTVTASKPGYEDKDKLGISVTEGKKTTGVDFTLVMIPPEQSGRISGVVMGEGNPITGKQSSSISCVAGKTDLKVGETQTISGGITPVVSGATVSIEYKSGSTETVRTVKTGSDGKYSDSYQPTVPGSWTAEASWEGDTKYSGDSETASFTVTQSPNSGNLKVTVLDSEAKPVVGAVVASTVTPSGQAQLSGTTGSFGTVQFNGVSVGQYTVQAVMTGYIMKSTSGQVLAGETATLSITLQASGGGTTTTGGGTTTTGGGTSTGGGIPGYPMEAILVGFVLVVVLLLVSSTNKRTRVN